MNKKQYNNVIDWTLKHDAQAQSEDSLQVTRTICNELGVALPQGDLAQVAEVLATDDYMGWKACTKEAAQEAANNGIPAIGISNEQIVVLAAKDEEQPVANSVVVMTLANDAMATGNSVAYYSYCCGTTTSETPTPETPTPETPTPENPPTVSVNDVLDKPYDPNYPYMFGGYPNPISEAQYYELLNRYSYEIRNEIVFDFTFQEIDSFRSYLVSSLFETSNKQEREQVVKDILALADQAISVITGVLPVAWPGQIIGAISVTSTVNALNSSTVQDGIRDITDCVEVFSHNVQGHTSTQKPNSVTYKISLLKQSPVAGRQIKIESSDGCKDLYTLENGAYDMALMAAMANAHGFTLYKVAPDWSYYWE